MTTTTETIHRAPTASTADRNIAIAKLDTVLKSGRSNAQRGMEALAKEYGLRHDLMVKPQALAVEVAKLADGIADYNAIEIGGARYSIKAAVTGADAQTFGLTRHARAQMFARASIPQTFGETLLAHGEAAHLVETFRRLLPKTSDDGILVRTVGGMAKGILSSSYRRMDASPVFESFLAETLKAGLVPYGGSVTDTRAFLAMILPEIVEIPTARGVDFVIFGVQLRNSDYGNGALQMDLFILRLLCLNGATGMDMMRKVHLGRRFDGFGEGGNGAEVVRLSQRTMDLDVATVQSAIRDVVGSNLKDHLTGLRDVVTGAAAKEISIPAALANLKKRGVKAEVIEQVKATYSNSALGVEALPQAEGAWRFSNVLSLLANDPKRDRDEAADLRDVAFEVLAPTGSKRRAALTWDDVKPEAQA